MVNFLRLKNILYYICQLTSNMSLQGTVYFPISFFNYSQPWIPIIIPNNQAQFQVTQQVINEVQFSNFPNYAQPITFNLSPSQGENLITQNKVHSDQYGVPKNKIEKNGYYNLRRNRNQNSEQKKQVEIKRDQPQPEKNSKQSQQKESLMDFNQIGKTSWTLEQQQKLKQMVNLFGKRWKYISEHFPNRTGKQIRQRYLNYLRPNLELGKWGEEEDKEILRLVQKHGRSWKTIQKKLKNRSQNQIKNRYYGHLNKNQKGEIGGESVRKLSNQKISLQKSFTNLSGVEEPIK